MNEETFFDDADIQPGVARRRVLMIAQNLADSHHRRLWRQAGELVADGYRVSVICPGEEGEHRRDILNGVSVYRYPAPFAGLGLLAHVWILFWEFILAWRVLLGAGFDVIHACNPPDGIFLIGGFFKFMFDKKFIFDHHVAMPELHETFAKGRGAAYYWRRFIERMAFGMADVAIAPNESYRRIAVTRGGMDADKVFVVRSAPAAERLKIVPPNAAWRRGKKYLVGCAGALGVYEGTPYLIEAARHIVHDLKRTDIHFALASSRDVPETFKAIAREKRVDEYITFMAHASESDIVEMLNTADICVSPDEVNPHNDKATLVRIVEYMALAKPIVQFELAEGNFSAAGASLYARANDAQDFGDKIVLLIDDPHKCAAMGATGRARFERALAWSHEARRLLAAYEVVFVEKYAQMAWQAN